MDFDKLFFKVSILFLVSFSSSFVKVLLLQLLKPVLFANMLVEKGKGKVVHRQ